MGGLSGRRQKKGKSASVRIIPCASAHSSSALNAVENVALPPSNEPLGPGPRATKLLADSSALAAAMRSSPSDSFAPLSFSSSIFLNHPASQVVMNINTMTFAARDFWRRQGASDEHTRRGSVRSEQRRLRLKDPPPSGLHPIWPVASSLLGHRSNGDMLPRCAKAWPG